MGPLVIWILCIWYCVDCCVEYWKWYKKSQQEKQNHNSKKRR